MPAHGGRLALLTALVLAATASAQDAAPPPPAPPREVSAETARDLARLEVLLPAFAEEARVTRLAVGSIFIATGLAAVPVGIVAETSWHQDYGVGLWVSGALFLGFGTLELFWQTPLERLDRDFQASAATLSPEYRLAYGAGGLASVAASAHGGRMVGAVLNFIFAGLFYGIAVGELVSASNNTGSNQTDDQSAAASSLVLGALFTGAAVAQLVFPTPAETAYAAYLSGASPAGAGLHLSGGVAPVRGGALVGLGGKF